MKQIEFGQWLQAEREKHGWSQSELARRSGQYRQVINKIENGGGSPAVETYLALADALELSPIVLFRAAGLLPPSTEERVTLDDWMHLLGQLPPEDQEEMRQIAVMKLNRRKSEQKMKSLKQRDAGV